MSPLTAQGDLQLILVRIEIVQYVNIVHQEKINER